MTISRFNACIIDFRGSNSVALILPGGGRVVQRCSVNIQCRGVLLVWIIVGQGPIALAIGAGGDCLDIFSLIYHFSFLSPSLWETARYRLKYCLKGPLNPEQPTNQINFTSLSRKAPFLEGLGPPGRRKRKSWMVFPLVKMAENMEVRCTSLS